MTEKQAHMTPISSTDHDQRTLSEATAEFARHDVKELPYGWSFRRCKSIPLDGWMQVGDDDFYSGEIAVLRWNRIIIHGNLPCVVYGGGDRGTPTERLRWLAECDCDMARDNVALGSRWTWSAHVALYEAADLPLSVEQSSHLKRLIRHHDEAAVHDFACGLGKHIGRVTSPDVLWTLAAARRVYEAVKGCGA